ncbi:hypothetical protein MTTB_09470 [Methanothermobacter tenebrarum]|uniref:Uncharacterized protein n=1 Tax=Methanothermobacter tenebrarum TaxID=680118 RepID=A0ABM7YDL2_9EURY|nr:hypothetical protein [Methanothermobacter tenebrarum]BDH79568.1 hypothetical protein MTTB_09470 [Methanothermobacter tenebrarum]
MPREKRKREIVEVVKFIPLDGSLPEVKPIKIKKSSKKRTKKRRVEEELYCVQMDILQ